MLGRWATALFVLGALVTTGCSSGQSASGPAPNTIAVTGTGSALSKPDRATVRFGVTKGDPDPRKAMSSASQVSNRILAALKKTGVEDKNLQTGSVRLEQVYSYPRDKPRHLDGYSASIDLSAKTRQLEGVGDVIVAGMDAGATMLHGISFDLDDTNPARYEASASAVKDARNRAQAMAKAAGRTLGAAISIGTPQPVGGSQYRLLDYSPNYSSPLLRSSAPAIQPGELSAGDSIQVVFALE